MVERSDQMRRRTRPGSCAAHRLAVDRDHPSALDVPGPSPRHHRELTVQRRGVDASEHLAHRGLLRGPREPETVKMLSAQIHSPFPDRSERAGTGHDRAHRDGEHPRQRIAHTSRVARIRNLAQHAQQGVIDVVEAGRGDRGRWHERVWSLSETACVGTPISAPRATPVTHATPITPRQTCRSKPPQPTFPGPCRGTSLASPP